MGVEERVEGERAVVKEAMASIGDDMKQIG